MDEESQQGEEEEVEVVAAVEPAQEANGGASPAGKQPAHPAQLLQPRALPAAALHPPKPAAQRAAKPQGRRVAFQPPAAEQDGEEAAATPQPHRGAADGEGSEGGGTPYDGVLAMLRQGPMAAAGGTPRSFPRPRSSSLLTAGAGRTPGPGLGFGGASASPSPLPPSGASEFGGSRRGGFVGSRLGPQGGSATPSTGLRTTYTARSGSRFSRTPVHMQPLAAGVPGGSGGAAAPTSRFGLAAAAAAGAGDAASAGAPGASLLSPAPLAWTPMRGSFTGGAAAVSGGKRKAESASPDGGEGASISLLDAQRRIRQKPEPAGEGERRQWRAGRTPFVKGPGGLSRLGSGLQQLQHERSASPAALPAAAAGGGAASVSPAAAAGTKATTDTARRILATLDALDKVVAASPPGGAAAAVAAAMGEGAQEEPAAASPPPTDSLGFAGERLAC